MVYGFTLPHFSRLSSTIVHEQSPVKYLCQVFCMTCKCGLLQSYFSCRDNDFKSQVFSTSICAYFKCGGKYCFSVLLVEVTTCGVVRIWVSMYPNLTPAVGQVSPGRAADKEDLPLGPGVVKPQCLYERQCKDMPGERMSWGIKTSRRLPSRGAAWKLL